MANAAVSTNDALAPEETKALERVDQGQDQGVVPPQQVNPAEPLEALAEREERVAQLTEALDAAGRQLQEQAQRAERLDEELRRTLARYRNALLAAAPDVPPELVQGDSVDALDLSLASAQQVVTRIRQQLEAKVAAERIPPGAPLRSTPDLSSLSPTEKILHGLRRLGR